MKSIFRALRLKFAAPVCAVVALSTSPVPLPAADLGDLLHRITGHAQVARKVAEFKDTFTIGGLTFSPDGNELVTSGTLAPPELHVWHWKDGSRHFESLAMPLMAGSGKGVTYSPDGRLLVAVHVPNHVLQGSPPPSPAIQVWDAQTKRAIVDVPMERTEGDISDIAFTKDGKLLVALQQKIGGSYVTAFATNSWKRAWDIDVGVKGFDAGTFALSPDDRRIAIGGRTFAFRDPAEHRILAIIRPVLAIVDLNTRKTLRVVTAPFLDNNEIKALAWSADSEQIAAGARVGGDENGTSLGPDALRIFEAASGAQVTSEKADYAYVSGLVYTPDGRYLVEGDVDKAVRIWDGRHETLYQAIPVDWHVRIFLAG